MCVFNKDIYNSIKNVKIHEINDIVNRYSLNIYDSEMIQEILTINPLFFDIALKEDQEIFLDAALDSINDIKEYKQSITIQTDFCLIRYKAVDNYIISVREDDQFCEILDDDLKEKIYNKIKKRIKRIDHERFLEYIYKYIYNTPCLHDFDSYNFMFLYSKTNLINKIIYSWCEYNPHLPASKILIKLNVSNLLETKSQDEILEEVIKLDIKFKRKYFEFKNTKGDIVMASENKKKSKKFIHL